MSNISLNLAIISPKKNYPCITSICQFIQNSLHFSRNCKDIDWEDMREILSINKDQTSYNFHYSWKITSARSSPRKNIIHLKMMKKCEQVKLFVLEQRSGGKLGGASHLKADVWQSRVQFHWIMNLEQLVKKHHLLIEACHQIGVKEISIIKGKYHWRPDKFQHIY